MVVTSKGGREFQEFLSEQGAVATWFQLNTPPSHLSKVGSLSSVNWGNSTKSLRLPVLTSVN
jgi:hypothetical protein